MTYLRDNDYIFVKIVGFCIGKHVVSINQSNMIKSNFWGKSCIQTIISLWSQTQRFTFYGNHCVHSQNYYRYTTIVAAWKMDIRLEYET